ncbi:hypothetical protein [Streptomyces sp. YGL11-2]|uniref:hypothetical protein n=1 Tax=Streptomyces sp. YGL11-2 TaxID=3414028 RepID=UPI003CE7D544
MSADTGLAEAEAASVRSVASTKHEDVVAALLLAVGEALPAPVRTGAPVLLVSARLSERQVDAFFAQCRDTGRRLRPLASVRMETSLTVQKFADISGWSGSSYALVTPGPAAAESAVRWATAAVASGRVPAAYVCEVVPCGPSGTLAVGLTVTSVAHDASWPRPQIDWTEPDGLRPRPYLLDAVADFGEASLSHQEV